MKPSRKPKVKRPDWEARCMEAATDAETAQEMYLEIKTERDALTEQLKVKDARIAELADVASQQSLEIINLRDDLQATRDRDDELMAAQREHLIRLRRIKNAGMMIVSELQTLHVSDEEKFSYELDGRGWVLLGSAKRAFAASRAYSAMVAALEVDCTLPAIPPKGTK